jgi:hypothetical protein
MIAAVLIGFVQSLVILIMATLSYPFFSLQFYHQLPNRM